MASTRTYIARLIDIAEEEGAEAVRLASLARTATERQAREDLQEAALLARCTALAAVRAIATGEAASMRPVVIDAPAAGRRLVQATRIVRRSPARTT